MRDDHLKGSDFFDAAKHSKIIFESSDIQKDSTTKEYNYVAKGKLTMKGVTKDANVLFNYIGKEFKDMGDYGKFDVGGFEGKTVIKRTDYGVGGTGGGAGDVVTINIALEIMQPAK